MQCPMIFCTGQQAFLNLVMVKWTGTVHVIQEDATVDNNRWYLDKYYIVCEVIPSTGWSWPVTSTSYYNLLPVESL